MTFSVLDAWALVNYPSTLTVDGESFTGVDLSHLDTIQLGTSGHSEVTDWTWAGSSLNPSATGDKATMLLTMIEHWTHDYKLPISEAGNYQVSAWVVGSFWSSTSQTWTMSLSLNGTSWTPVDTFTDDAFMKWEKLQGQIEASGSGFVWVRFETSDSENPLVAGLMLEKEDAGGGDTPASYSGSMTPSGAFTPDASAIESTSSTSSAAFTPDAAPPSAEVSMMASSTMIPDAGVTAAHEMTPTGDVSLTSVESGVFETAAPSALFTPDISDSASVSMTPTGTMLINAGGAIGHDLTPTGDLSLSDVSVGMLETVTPNGAFSPDAGIATATSIASASAMLPDVAWVTLCLLYTSPSPRD